MSERSFHRQFRSFAGKSPGEHQLESRISLAERLLSTTALPITEIAFRAGFSDGNYFSRSFGKARSVSPREYRRRNRMQVR
jgi:AraC family L-rhamnose operon transcriptional activator RhaR/AraC family L-rhamnose operon regulatory protein RhaS